MTRNTRTYRAKFKDLVVEFRDLTTLELSFLSNIKNHVYRYDMAAYKAIINPSPDSVPWAKRINIGEQLFDLSTDCMTDVQLLEVTVSEFRDKANGDEVLLAIKAILDAFPGQSIDGLLNMTHRDLIELACLAESYTGKTIYNIGKVNKKGMKLVNPNELPDSDKETLQQKMDALNKHLGR